MISRLFDLWNERELQILVILSFTLQVFLLLFGGIRRRNASFSVRIFLWFVYLLADATAIYTLGHMASSGRNSDGLQHLVAFWAPFLILHLGGQDTITAYALEDNELWLRHLLGLGVQSFGAAYLLLKYIRAAGLLIPASILVFVTGILKYGERIWALKCASTSCMQRSVLAEAHDFELYPSYTFLTNCIAIWRRSHSHYDSSDVYYMSARMARTMLPFGKRLFVGSPVASEWRSPRDYLNRGFGLRRHRIHRWSPSSSYSGPWLPAKHISQIIDMELSAMYDLFFTKSVVIQTLFTKSEVIRTFCGLGIRAFSFSAVISALVLFIVSRSDDGDYRRSDVAVTYVLLVGAAVLEFTSFFRVMASVCSEEWPKLESTLISLRWRLRTSWLGRRWLLRPIGLGQYNMISMSASRSRIDIIRGKIAKVVGLEDLWNKAHYSTFIPASPAVVDVIYTEVKRRAELTVDEAEKLNQDFLLGRWMTRRHITCDEELENQREKAQKMEFMEFILSYHVATDIVAHRCCHESEKKNTGGDLPQVVMALSNYMMYLLRMHPDILPRTATTHENDGTSWNRLTHDETFNILLPQLFNFIKVNPEVAIEQELGHKPQDILLATSNAPVIRISFEDVREIIKKDKVEIAFKAARAFDEGQELQSKYESSAFSQGSKLAADLLAAEISSRRKLEVLVDLWVDTLLYVADGVTANFHAKQLSSGGEFLTFVSLLMALFGLQKDALDYDPPKDDEAHAGEDGNSADKSQEDHERDNNSKEISEDAGTMV